MNLLFLRHLARSLGVSKYDDIFSAKPVTFVIPEMVKNFNSV